MNARIAVPVVALFVLSAAVAGENEPKRTQAVSKEVYDIVVRVNDAAKHLESLGINPKDIEPDNLGFASSSFSECVDLANESASGESAEAIALVSCFRRHPPVIDNDIE